MKIKVEIIIDYPDCNDEDKKELLNEIQTHYSENTEVPQTENVWWDTIEVKVEEVNQ